MTRAQALRVLTPAGAAVAVVIVSLAAWRFHPWTNVTRAVGEQDDLVFRNFHDAARAEGAAYRYSKGGDRGRARASHVTLPQVGRCRESVLQLEVHTPADQPPVALTVLGGGETLLARSIQGPATLDVALPGDALEGGDVDVALVASPWKRGQNPRLLGVAVERVTWTPRSWTWPPLRQLVILPLLAAAVAAQALALGARARSAALAGVIAGGAAALAAAWRPLEVAPFSLRLLLLALAIGATQLAAAQLLRERGAWASSLPPLIGPEALVPVLAAGYGALWLFDLALCGESAGAFCPPRALTAVALATAVLVAALAPIHDRPRRLRWSGAALLAGAIAAGVVLLGALLRRPAVDFLTLWNAARLLAAGQSAYDLAHVTENHFGAVFKVPPFYGMLLLPFARLSFDRALLVHRAVDVALYVGCGALLVRLLRPHVGRATALAAVALVMGLMHPTFDTISYGQIDVVLLAALTAALLALRTGRPALAGLAIAFGTLLKLYPVLLAGDALARRDWKLLASIAAGLVLLIALAVAVVGWHEHVVYATAVLPHIGGGTGWIENQTLNGFASRWLGFLAPRPVTGTGITAFTAVAFALVMGLTMLAAARRHPVESPARALQYALFLVATLVAVPAAWMHYATLTVLPFVLLVWDAARRPFTRGAAFTAALAFGLVAYGNEWTFFDGRAGPGLGVLALSLKLYGLLALWLLVLTRVWTPPAPSSPAQ